MAGQYQDFVVVVTGASTGLGRAVAVETAAQGAQAVVINYAKNRADAEETARLCEAHGAEAVLVQGDVARDADCIAIAAAAERFGRIDALFNNAGTTTFAGHADMDAVSADDFQRLYSVNVIGPFQMIRAARALLEAAPRPGAVVNTSSIAGVVGIGEAGAERVRANAAANTPLKAASSADDIAAAAVFLASPASRHVTGETLIVDAGSHLGFAPLVAR